MLIGTKVYLEPNATILFENNHADFVGGAIYVFEYEVRDVCFYNIYFNTTAKMMFINNTESYGGSSLYGDGLAQCSTYNQVINVNNTEEDPSAVAGESHSLCFCEQDKHQPNCSRSNRHYTIANVFPGQDFTIRLATVSYFTKGNAPGVIPGAIHAYSTSKIPLN